MPWSEFIKGFLDATSRAANYSPLPGVRIEWASTGDGPSITLYIGVVRRSLGLSWRGFNAYKTGQKVYREMMERWGEVALQAELESSRHVQDTQAAQQETVAGL